MADIYQVPAHLVHRTWPKVEQFFADVEPHMAGDLSLEQMRGKMFTGAWSLLVFVEDETIIGAFGMFYENRLNQRVAFIPALGGKGVTTPENWAKMKAIFTDGGATHVEAAMRGAALRLWERLGFEEKYRVAGVAL